MSIWDWVHRRQLDAYLGGSDDQQEMVRLFEAVFDARRDDPDRALGYLHASREIAERIGDVWWARLMDHWELQVLIHNKKDNRAALELGTKAAVEVRKPVYAELPQRVCIHEDLISTYQEADPVGYAEMIQNAIDYMSNEVTPQVECYLCLQAMRAEFALGRDELDDAQAHTERYIAGGEGEPHHLGIGYNLLAQIAHKQEDYDRCLEYARAAESEGAERPDSTAVMNALAWQALALQKLGEPDEAQRVHITAASLASNYGAGLDDCYYDAQAAFLEAREDLQGALTLRERHLEKTIVGNGRHFQEARVRLEVLRLRKTLGLPLAEEIERTEAVLIQLKDPSTFAEQLAQYTSE